MRFARVFFALVPMGGALAYAPMAVRLIGSRSRRDSADRSAEPETTEEHPRIVDLQHRIQTLEKRVQSLTREAQEAARSKDDFLASLSHELRTPLNATLGWIQLLRLHIDEPVIRDHAIDVLERNARAQIQIVSDLLDLSRIVTGRMHLSLDDLDLAEIVGRTCESLAQTAAAKNVTLRVDASSVDRPISGDRLRLEQVVRNLVGNALKFTPAGGKVTVTLSQDAAHARLVVRDTGVGIATDKLSHIFERLCQADSSPTRSFGGLGVGLAIVQHLVQLHGGSVQAESAGPGCGATFTVRLPFHATA